MSSDNGRYRWVKYYLGWQGDQLPSAGGAISWKQAACLHSALRTRGISTTDVRDAQ